MVCSIPSYKRPIFDYVSHRGNTISDSSATKAEPPKDVKKDTGLVKGPSKSDLCAFIHSPSSLYSFLSILLRATASNTMAANAASSAGGAAGQAVTREDLEQFKKEIFDYIDRAKREILEAMK